MAKPKSGRFANPPVNVKIVLSGLWASTMFLYIYNDIFTVYRPGTLQTYLDGNLGPMGPVTQWLLLAFAGSMVPPSLMVILSLVLPPSANRWANIFWGLFSAVFNAALAVFDTWYYYQLLSAVEVVLGLMVVWRAWTWPRQESTSVDRDNSIA